MDDASWAKIRAAAEGVERGDVTRVDVDTPERSATIYAVGGPQLVRIDLKEKK